MNTVHVPMMAGALAILALAVVYGIANGQFKKALRQNNRRLPLQARFAEELASGHYRLVEQDPVQRSKMRKILLMLVALNVVWMLLTAHWIKSALTVATCAQVFGIFYPVFKIYSLVLLMAVNFGVLYGFKRKSMQADWQQGTLRVSKAFDAQFYLVKNASKAEIAKQHGLPFLLLLGLMVWMLFIYLPYVGTGPDRHLDFRAYQQQRVQQCLAQQAKDRQEQSK